MISETSSRKDIKKSKNSAGVTHKSGKPHSTSHGTSHQQHHKKRRNETNDNSKANSKANKNNE